MQKQFILCVVLFVTLLVGCTKKDENGLTGSCVEAFKSWEIVHDYIANHPGSPLTKEEKIQQKK